MKFAVIRNTKTNQLLCHWEEREESMTFTGQSWMETREEFESGTLFGSIQGHNVKIFETVKDAQDIIDLKPWSW